jgi:hypothetical protein
LVERRPEKAGVASSILAPGTIFCFFFARRIVPPEQIELYVGSNQPPATKKSFSFN